MNENMKKLEEMAKEMQEFLLANYSPHTNIVITSTRATLQTEQFVVINEDIMNDK